MRFRKYIGAFCMKKLTLLIAGFLLGIAVWAQPSTRSRLEVPVVDDQKTVVPFATVSLLRYNDSLVIATSITDSSGISVFENISMGQYRIRVSMVNRVTQYSGLIQLPLPENERRVQAIILPVSRDLLQEVTVSGRKPFIQQLADKTVINVEASITSAGATVMEVLEKSPGVSVDRDGNISLKGKSQVLILIDGKPTYLSGTDLAGLLNGMSASQVEQIELMTNPPAKYDAAGNAGIINIRTKKNRQQGFNGTMTVGFGQGRYPKTNNNVALNFRSGKFNFFLNYNVNAAENFMDMYALRTYFKQDGKTVDAQLEQPTLFSNKFFNQSWRTGIDFFADKKTTIGIIYSGLDLSRDGESRADAQWLSETGTTDSVIHSLSTTSGGWGNNAINLNARHVINAKKEITADFDFLGYKNKSNTFFQNNLDVPGGYEESIKGNLPSEIKIFSGKVDYTDRFSSTGKMEAGWKSSRVSTDNLAEYFYLDNNSWLPDLNRTNHFLYTENIHALYGNVEKQFNNVTLQTGLRYEYTAYDGNQLGNAARKDSAFSRRYNSLFPTIYFSYKADSQHTISLSAGRRIDRPAFQKLNPFVFIINKYTNQVGNPYFKPQYTWNFVANHLYKELLVTSVSYSYVRDYFSQIFLADTSGNIIYTEGNLGRMQSIGLSMSLHAKPTSWWTFNLQADFLYKKIEGVLWKAYTAEISQLNMNMSNQLLFNKGWAAELSGFYITRAQNDIQEILEPNGQISAGVSKQILQKKATIRLNVRDIFWTNRMAGLTYFEKTEEYFTIKRDSRVINLSLTWRFGKAFKAPAKRGSGAQEEMNRVGTGG